MKKKIFLSPLIIIILIIIFGIGIAGAAIYLGGRGEIGGINLQKGLVGWWKFDGNAKDSSPYGNNGTVTGAVLTTDRKEQANKAYSFNGTTSHVSVPSSTSLQPTNAVTIEFWVKPN